MQRVAIYFAPPAGSPLMRAASTWLGRDPFGHGVLEQPGDTGIAPSRLAEITAAPRWYGFHATLKAPFALHPDRTLDELRAALAGLVSGREGFTLALEVGVLSGFLALLPTTRSEPLQALADDCVRLLDPFRAPLSAAERARRRPERLTPAQLAHLDRWGYPHVLGEFRFHMTLTDRLVEPELSSVRKVLEHRFVPLLTEPVPVDGLTLFGQPQRDAPFTVVDRFPFGRRA